MDLCTEHRLLDHKELTHRHMRVSERITSGAHFDLLLISKSEHLGEFHSNQILRRKQQETAAFMHARVCPYLEKVAHSPRGLWQNEALVQERSSPLAASSQS